MKRSRSEVRGPGQRLIADSKDEYHALRQILYCTDTAPKPLICSLTNSPKTSFKLPILSVVFLPTALVFSPYINTMQPSLSLPPALHSLRARYTVDSKHLHRLVPHSILQIRLDAGFVTLPLAQRNMVHKHLVYLRRASVHALRHDEVG